MRVLVIEDDPDILALCGVTLAREGHRVLEATTVDSGLEVVLKDQPDLVLLDIMLPGRDGFSLLEELVSTPATTDIPVVLLTAKTSAEARARGWEAGASGYITKPFTPAMLNETVRTVATRSPEELSRVRNHALSVVAPTHPGT